MAFEVPPGSGGQYFSLKLQRVKHHLRDVQGPGLPSAVPQGFWFLNATLPKILEIQGASDCGLSAGSPVGTVMPYLLLMGKGAFLSSMVTSWRGYAVPGGAGMAAGSFCSHDLESFVL